MLLLDTILLANILTFSLLLLPMYDFWDDFDLLEKGGLITNDNIEVFGLNNYTKTLKSGKFYNVFGKRNIKNGGNEFWWISFSRKDGINNLGYVKYRNENDEEK